MGISDRDCKKCGADAECRALYEFEEVGETVPVKYWYCEDCAQKMHDRYGIDAILHGASNVDIDLSD